MHLCRSIMESAVMAVLLVLVGLSILLAMTRPSVATVIHDGLPVDELENYTIRYLSAERGNDTTSCLSSQAYPPGSLENDTDYCGSLVYTLTGGYERVSRDVNNLVVIILPGTYQMGKDGITLVGYSNVFLTKITDTPGEAVIKCYEPVEDRFNNLYVVGATNFSLNGIVFTECGSYSSPVRLQRTVNSTVSNCTFRNNHNCGLTTDRSRQILIIDSIFQNNNSTSYYESRDTLDPGAMRFGGGLLITWRSMDRREARDGAVVRNCTFINNIADVNFQNLNDSRPHFYRPRGHGGAIVVAFEDVNNYTISIESSRIIENTAVSSGGGIFAMFFKGSANNEIVVRNTTFEGNRCNQDGGAISVNTFQVADNNKLIVEGCSFDGNQAQLGGGACSFNLQDALVPEGTKAITNVAAFTNSNFTRNTSPTGGSAVQLVSSSLVNQVLATTDFTNCTFYGNKAQSLREGALMSFKFPISLAGTNVFERNEGGGISLMQSRVDVGGTVRFIENSAVNGGGLALEDQCLIHLLRGSEMEFVGNAATLEGGAIYHRASSVAVDINIVPLFNTGCFIQYEVNTEPFSVHPANWETNIVFINNTAGKDGAALYATSIDRCTYVPSLNTTNSTTVTVLMRSIFEVSPPFHLSNNHVVTPLRERVSESIATAPSQPKVALSQPQFTVGAPGEVFVFDVAAFDEAGNQQAAIWNINELSNSAAEREREEYLSIPVNGGSKTYRIKGLRQNFSDFCSLGVIQRSLKFSLVQVVTGGVRTVESKNITISCCHPGYTFNEKSAVCEIISELNNSIIIRPHLNGRYFYAQSDLYVESRNGTLVSAVIPPSFQACTRDGVRPGCLVKYDAPSEQCSNGRKGFLCGQCPEGQGVDLTLRQCRNCTIQDAVFMALFFIVFFILSLLILFFNVPIPNELKGFLFFIQVVGFVYDRSNVIDWDFHLSRSFGFSLHLFLCPSPGYNALVTTAYGFIITILTTLAIVIYIICARFSKVLSNRSSFDGIWFLCIIAYKYTADTCFNLLRCQKVSGAGTLGEFVYFYDGSIKCIKSSHCINHCLDRCSAGVSISFLNIAHQFQDLQDVLTKGIKVSCRWWSGFDLFRRLFFTIIVLFFNYVQPAGTQIALFFTGLVVYVISVLVKPYKSSVANVVEAMVLTDLLLLTALFLNTDRQEKAAIEPLSQLLLLLPFIAAGLYATLKIISMIWKKCASVSHSTFVAMLSSRYKQVVERVSSVREFKAKTSKEPSELEPRSDKEQVPKLLANYTAFREELIESRSN